MQLDFSNCIANVYRSTEKGTRFVKVSFPDIGLYIGAIRVVEFIGDLERFEVYPPMVQIGGKWRADVEFDKSRELWGLIREEALNAVLELD